MSSKKQLPAKYSKMVVCTYWVLNQLKESGKINSDDFKNICSDFHLFDKQDDQMIFFEDVVENFKEHETNLKSFTNFVNNADEPTQNAKPKQKAKPIQPAEEQDMVALILGLNAKPMIENDADANADLETVSKEKEENEEKNIEIDVSIYENKTIVELRKIAKDAGLSSSGKKMDIMKRLAIAQGFSNISVASEIKEQKPNETNIVVKKRGRPRKN